MSIQLTHRSQRLLVMLAVTVLLLAGQQSLSTLRMQGAALSGGETRPTVTPIPRPTLTPALAPPAEPSRRSGDEVVVGSHIVLQALAHTRGLWTIVQWQDQQGGWHDVMGWHSQFSRDQRVRWWVAPKDTGTGPFRWIIYEKEKRQQVLWTSAAFYLPSPGEELIISASVPPVEGTNQPEGLSSR